MNYLMNRFSRILAIATILSICNSHSMQNNLVPTSIQSNSTVIPALFSKAAIASGWKTYVADPFWQLPKKYQIAIGIGGAGLAAAATYKAANSLRDYRYPAGAIARAVKYNDEGKLRLALNRIKHNDFKEVVRQANQQTIDKIYTASIPGPNKLTDVGRLMLTLRRATSDALESLVNQADQTTLQNIRAAAVPLNNRLTNEQKFILLFSPDTFDHNFPLTIAGGHPTKHTIEWLLQHRNEDVNLPRYIEQSVRNTGSSDTIHFIALLCNSIARSANDAAYDQAQKQKLIAAFSALLAISNVDEKNLLQILPLYIPGTALAYANYIDLCKAAHFSIHDWRKTYSNRHTTSRLGILIRREVVTIWNKQLHAAISAGRSDESNEIFSSAERMSKEMFNELITERYRRGDRMISLIGHSFIVADNNNNKSTLGKWLVDKRLNGVDLDYALLYFSIDAVLCDSVGYITYVMSHPSFTHAQLVELQRFAEINNASEKIMNCIKNVIALHEHPKFTDLQSYPSYVDPEDEHLYQRLFPARTDTQWVFDHKLNRSLTEKAAKPVYMLHHIVTHANKDLARMYIETIVQGTTAEERGLFDPTLKNPVTFICCDWKITPDERSSLFESLCSGFNTDQKREILLSLITFILNDEISRFDLKRIYCNYHSLCEHYFTRDDWRAAIKSIMACTHPDRDDLQLMVNYCDTAIIKITISQKNSATASSSSQEAEIQSESHDYLYSTLN